jgi:hypothetical protein
MELELSIKQYIENNNKDATSQEEQDRLLNELPPSLKAEVVAFT